MIDYFIADLKNLYDDILNNRFVDISGFKAKWNIDGSIGDAYQLMSKKELKKEIGSFYTPHEIVEYMCSQALKDIDYSKNPYIRILDPSCGGGYFLISIFMKLREMAKAIGIKNADAHILKNNIYGYDTDINAVMICIIEFYEITGCFNSNIAVKDFLMEEAPEFDIIIGNPPYMGHKVLTGDYREGLYNIFGKVFYDKADISYCFIKKSIDILKAGGRLLFFTSRYIMEALNGEGIRRYLSDMGFIKNIIDFYGVRVVKGAGIDNIIFDFTKGGTGEFTEVFRLNESARGIGKEIFNDILDGTHDHVKYTKVKMHSLNPRGWIFLNDIEIGILNKIKGVELRSFCEGFQGIITGCDKAFVMNYEEVLNEGIEDELLKPWIKNKNIESFNVTKPQELLIYSDLITDVSKYKAAINHIQGCSDQLKNRRECKSGIRKWYELQWGRNINLFEETKIVYPYKACSNRFAIDCGNYFSADVYAIKIMDMFKSNISYEFLAGILNSSLYEFYIKSMAKKLGENMYEYYPNKIMTLRIPEYIKEIDDEVIIGGENIRERIDKILNKNLGITQEEYEIIKTWCS